MSNLFTVFEMLQQAATACQDAEHGKVGLIKQNIRNGYGRRIEILGMQGDVTTRYGRG